MGLRPNGDPVIAYYDATFGALKLAERIQNVWHTQFITPVEGGFNWCALAIDSDGTPHVVYAPQIGLRHLARLGGFWEKDTITVSSGQASSDGSIAMDAGNQLHVIYATSSGANYAHRDTNGWQVELIDLAHPSTGGQFSSVAVRSDGTPIACFQRSGLRVFARTASGWDEDHSIPETPNVYSTSMVLGRDGFPRIAFGDGTAGVSFAQQGPQGWHVAPIAPPTTNIVYSVSLCLNSRDEPIVAFGGGSLTPVMLAFGGPNIWQVQVVDSSAPGSPTSGWCSLALESQGFPRVAYYTAGAGSDLRFAEGPAGLSVYGLRPSVTSLSVSSPRPNPARALETVAIECRVHVRRTVGVALYDISGREIARGPLTQLEPGLNTLRLNLPALPSGVILAACYSDDGQVLASRRLAILR